MSGRRAPKPAASAAGFTLIEIMISMAILASMFTIVWGSFSLTAKNRSVAEGISDRYHQVRTALSRMTREISMAYLSKHDELGTLNPRTRFVSEQDGAVDRLTFSSLAHMALGENAREGDQTLITYFVAADPHDAARSHLWRRATRRLGVENPGEDGAAYIMLEDVEVLHYLYFDDQDNEWREDWNTTNLDGQPDRLPQKVQIALTLADERKQPLPLTTATRLFLRDAIWFSATD